jgi:antirestriction protein ArdC
MKNDANSTSRQDVYSRITSQIVASLEQGVRPWVKPWNAEHAAGRITQPLRFNGQPYSGINILSLWMSATARRQPFSVREVRTISEHRGARMA